MILNDDERNTEIIRIDVEFQVIEHLTYEYLIKYGIDPSEDNVINLAKVIIAGANNGTEFDLYKIRNKIKR